MSSLYELWKANPSQFREKRVDQIIVFAGDGKLGDRNSAPHEFRGLLAKVPAETLVRYAEECLTSFADSGLALQDIVNEIGTRLGFEVERGRYRGTKNEIGFDGIWSGPDGHQIVAEVKTTDAYRMPIDTVANYRRALIKDGRIVEERSSVLVIVGREDTGELEAQIRGSRHAWDVTLISIDALTRLMHIRQELDDPRTESKIRALLVPHEYTRIDDIIDLVFSTTEDILEQTTPLSDVAAEDDATERPPRDKPVSFNRACAVRISEHLEADLNKVSRITYSDTELGLTVTCSVSKEYDDPRGAGYWFAFHPHQLEKLTRAHTGYAAFGCGSPDQIALLPVDFMEAQLSGMNQTRLDDENYYWHIQIHRDGARWILHRRKGEDWPDITEMMLITHQQTA